MPVTKVLSDEIKALSSDLKSLKTAAQKENFEGMSTEMQIAKLASILNTYTTIKDRIATVINEIHKDLNNTKNSLQKRPHSIVLNNHIQDLKEMAKFLENEIPKELFNIETFVGNLQKHVLNEKNIDVSKIDFKKMSAVKQNIELTFKNRKDKLSQDFLGSVRDFVKNAEKMNAETPKAVSAEGPLLLSKPKPIKPRTPAEKKLLELAEIGRALNSLVELTYYSNRHAQINQRSIEPLLKLLIQIQDCLPKDISHLECRTHDICYSTALYNNASVEDYYDLLTKNGTKMPEIILGEHSRGLEALGPLQKELETMLTSLKDKGMVHAFNELGIIIFAQLDNINKVLRKDLFALPKDHEILYKRFKESFDKRNKEPATIWEAHSKIIEKGQLFLTPMIFMEFLKSYISTVEASKATGVVPVQLKKDQELVAASLEFMKKHMGKNEFADSLRQINEIVDLAAKEKTGKTIHSNIEEAYQKKPARRALRK